MVSPATQLRLEMLGAVVGAVSIGRTERKEAAVVLVTVTLSTTADAEVETPPVDDPDGLVPATWMVREEPGVMVLDWHWVRLVPERLEGL